MVWLKNVGGKKAYVCGECGLGYADATTAISCEMYCREHKKRNPRLAGKAITSE